MTRVMTLRAACVTAGLLAACSPSGMEEAAKATSNVDQIEVAAGVQELEPAPDHAGQSYGLDIDEETEAYLYRFVTPGPSAEVPELQAWFQRRMEETRRELIAQTSEERAEAERAGYPYRAHAYMEEWIVVADVQDWLSMYARIWQYTGGAHGMSHFDALVWDRRSATALNPKDMFVSQEALSSAVRADFCLEIDRQRAQRREIPLNEVAGDELFGQCIDIDSASLVLGSAHGQGFDRIGFLIPPYEAGPYAEGSYEFSLPVTTSIIAAVRPQYQDAFVVLP